MSVMYELMTSKLLVRHLNQPYHVQLSSPHGFRVSNLMFVDDCLIFYKAPTKTIRNTLNILNSFSVPLDKEFTFISHNLMTDGMARVAMTEKPHLSDIICHIHSLLPTFT